MDWSGLWCFNQAVWTSALHFNTIILGHLQHLQPLCVHLYCLYFIALYSAYTAYKSIQLFVKCLNIYIFSRRFYPKRLTMHSGYTFCISMCVSWESNPQPFALLTQCSTTEPQEMCICYLLNVSIVLCTVWSTLPNFSLTTARYSDVAIRAVTITAPTAVMRSSPSSPHCFLRTRPDFLQRGNQTR